MIKMKEVTILPGAWSYLPKSREKEAELSFEWREKTLLGKV